MELYTGDTPGSFWFEATDTIDAAVCFAFGLDAEVDADGCLFDASALSEEQRRNASFACDLAQATLRRFKSQVVFDNPRLRGSDAEDELMGTFTRRVDLAIAQEISGALNAQHVNF